MACLFWVLEALGPFKPCPFQEDHKESQGTLAKRRWKSLLRVLGAEEEGDTLREVATRIKGTSVAMIMELLMRKEPVLDPYEAQSGQA